MLAVTGMAYAQETDTLQMLYGTNLRQTPKYSGVSVAIIKQGDTVIVFNEFRGTYVKANYKEFTGYLNYKLVNPSDIFREWAYSASLQETEIAKDDEEIQLISPAEQKVKQVLPPAEQKAKPTVTQPSNKTNPTTTRPAYRPASSNRYTRGPRGGCFYLSSSGKKVYVDKSLCN